VPERNGEIPVESRKEKTPLTSSPPVRGYRTALFSAVLFLAIVFFSALTVLVKTTPAFPVDLQISRIIQTIDAPLFAGLMIAMSWPGFFPQSLIITLFIAFALERNALRWEALTALLGASFSAILTESIKIMIQRPRPPADLVDVISMLTSYGFPSGHVMFYLNVFGFVWYLTYTLFQPSLKRSFLLGFSTTLILMVGISRIYLGHHWASDVLGAYLLGSLTLMGIILFYQWGRERFFKPK
jgi:undecaprenyl-diphosphatase